MFLGCYHDGPFVVRISFWERTLALGRRWLSGKHLGCRNVLEFWIEEAGKAVRKAGIAVREASWWSRAHEGYMLGGYKKKNSGNLSFLCPHGSRQGKGERYMGETGYGNIGGLRCGWYTGIPVFTVSQL